MPPASYKDLQSCLNSGLLQASARFKMEGYMEFKDIVEEPFSDDDDDDPKGAAAEKCHNIEAIGSKEALHSTHNDSGIWSFLHPLSINNINTSYHLTSGGETSMGKGSCYMHPSERISSSPRLCEKSLELCTEQLGSESGADMTESCNIFSDVLFPDNNGRTSTADYVAKSREKKSYTKKVMRTFDHFPPPLTTMAGPNRLQVRHHREEGRLVIEAVESPSAKTCFRAERSNGRLRLELLVKRNEEDSELEDVKGNQEECAETERSGSKSNKDDDDDDDGRNKQEEQEEDGEDVGDESSSMKNKKDVEGVDVNFYGIQQGHNDVVETRMEKLQRPSGCKEGSSRGNKRLCHWNEPLWVASS